MTDPNGLIRRGRAAPGFTLPATLQGRQTGPGDGILDALEPVGADRRVMAG